MDINSEIESVIEEIRNAKNVPFSASAMIDRQALLDRLEAIRQNLPEEIKQSRWVLRDRDEMLGKSQKESETMLADARAERDRLVARTEIVNAANREADKIIEEAKDRAREIRMEAEDYVDSKLASFEVVLQKTMAAVQRGRDRLRGGDFNEPETLSEDDRRALPTGPPPGSPAPAGTRARR